MSGITPQSTDFPKWYNEVLHRAEMADHSPVRGCMVIRPYAYAIWENMQRDLDKRFKDLGHVNAYFPLLIPNEFIEREKKHLEGFSPELAVVTVGGGEILKEPLVVRPTSETVIGHMYSEWVKSYRDLPILINQWANVIRWEKRPRLFLRTTEFLWQEGHTAHASHEEAEKEALAMLDVYVDFSERKAAIPVIAGRKSESETFPGALVSYTIEGMMKDGKALQMGTSHDLGQNFSKTFKIQYLDVDGKLQHCWTTSWGVSTRLIGAVVMAHGDDKGLILPPELAPIQVVIVPIYGEGADKADIRRSAEKLAADLRRTARVKLDDREEHRPGWKFNEWEMRGVPLRIELGPRDIQNRQAILARRDDGQKTTVALDDLKGEVRRTLRSIQKDMLARARTFRNDRTVEATTYQDLKAAVESGFARAFWCGSASCEERIKAETKATNRCIPLKSVAGSRKTGECIRCGSPARERALFARAY